MLSVEDGHTVDDVVDAGVDGLVVDAAVVGAVVGAGAASSKMAAMRAVSTSGEPP